MNTRERKRNNIRATATMAVLMLIGIGIGLIWLIQLVTPEREASLNTGTIAPSTDTQPSIETTVDDRTELERFAQEHNLSLSAWPAGLTKLMEVNPETTDFVLNYPLKKDLSPEIDLSEYIDCSEVPLFMQWDERWGYFKYGNQVMGLSGCGPTCLSMVCVYLLDDPQYSPRYIAEFSQENGYCVPGNGSSWTLISEGGVTLGLDVIEIPLVESRIVSNLEAGNPIICVMGPGDFTDNGHYIVMTGYVDGKIKVNDPNSKIRSEMLWDYDAIEDQIRNLWVCRELSTDAPTD